jgi:hypothetical protein
VASLSEWKFIPVAYVFQIKQKLLNFSLKIKTCLHKGYRDENMYIYALVTGLSNSMLRVLQ